jgi:hypothetical protein
LPIGIIVQRVGGWKTKVHYQVVWTIFNLSFPSASSSTATYKIRLNCQKWKAKKIISLFQTINEHILTYFIPWSTFLHGNHDLNASLSWFETMNCWKV